MRVEVRALAVAMLLALPGAGQEAVFFDQVEVSVHEVTARVLAPDGSALAGLAASDFEVLVDGERAELVAADWHGPVTGEMLPPSGVSEQAAGVVAPGRLVILFFQLDFDRSRLPGLVRMSRRAADLIRTLTPADRAAVLTFGSHLELHLDLTADRERLLQAVLPTSLFGPPGDPATLDEPSLLPQIDLAAGRAAAHPEQALRLVGEALEPIPGVKSVVFIGFGMGRFGRSGVRMEREYGAARRALARSRATIFTLDVTEADYHSLEVGLQTVAGDTGGFYTRTHEFSWGATQRLQGALTGYYVLAFSSPAKRGLHVLSVRLATRRGDVLVPTSFEN